MILWVKKATLMSSCSIRYRSSSFGWRKPRYSVQTVIIWVKQATFVSSWCIPYRLSSFGWRKPRYSIQTVILWVKKATLVSSWCIPYRLSSFGWRKPRWWLHGVFDIDRHPLGKENHVYRCIVNFIGYEPVLSRHARKFCDLDIYLFYIYFF